MPISKHHMFFGFKTTMTDEQLDYVNSIFDNRLTMVNAPSGSGKTTMAVAVAKLLGKDLVYIFSPVEEGKMGYRKGTQQEKEQAYTIPLIDALLEIGENPEQVIYTEELPSDNTGRRKNNRKPQVDKVWVYPKSHIFARGTNLQHATIIIDECQNFTRGELKKILTRCHDNCTVVMIGHTGQCDLDDPQKSGFQAYIDHFKDQDYAKVCTLTKNFRGELAKWADELNW